MILTPQWMFELALYSLIWIIPVAIVLTIVLYLIIEFIDWLIRRLA